MVSVTPESAGFAGRAAPSSAGQVRMEKVPQRLGGQVPQRLERNGQLNADRIHLVSLL